VLPLVSVSGAVSLPKKNWMLPPLAVSATLIFSTRLYQVLALIVCAHSVRFTCPSE
jgi:hypothetical protein